MKNFTKIFCLALIASVFGCAKPDSPVPEDPENEIPEVPEVPEEGYVESVPDTLVFTNSKFIYNGDDIGTAESDGWVIKLYTDMEIDDYGNPVGPGSVVQMLLNVAYDENQSADPEMLVGRYVEMINSGNFAPGTFVSGYLAYIDVPGGRIEMADATFYADVKDGSSEMDYDMIDEGAVVITGNEDDTYTITGVLVGKKYTKRYFTWTGTVTPESYVPEEIPNSTLTADFMGVMFAKAQIQDKGDCFFLGDQSYRCLLLYLADETIDLSSYRPAGDGFVLRMEILVPWDTDMNDGIPAGVYEMVQRNQDTSIDKDKIVPGAAIPGLPDIFAEWKLGGTWFYELKESVWTETYARIEGGSVVVERGDDGSHTISYDFTDCQKSARRIQGSSTFTEVAIF